MAKKVTKVLTVRYRERKGKTAIPSAPVTLRRYKDALIFEFECGGKEILKLEITGGGQLHITDANGYKHLSAYDFLAQNKKIKGSP